MIEVYAYEMANLPDAVIQQVPATDGVIHLINPSCKVGMESAGSFEFSVYPNDPYYNEFRQIKTIIAIKLDGEAIFYGRVLTISNGFYGEKKINCEGALSILLDSYYPPSKENDRPKIEAIDWITRLISNHNSAVGANNWRKHFNIGEMPGHYSDSIESPQRIENAVESFGNTSWQQTKSALEDLKSHYGGCFRVRVVNDQPGDTSFVDTIGQYGRGNIDLNNRIVVYNQDGSISTERSFSVNIDNQEVLLPTVINGQIKSEDYAIDYYYDHGEYLGKFDTVEEAEEYAEALHERQEWYYTRREGQRGGLLLDWLDQYFNKTENTQTIEIGKNLIDISKVTEVDNIFTVVIPVGKKNNAELYIDGYREDIHGSGNFITIPMLTDYYSREELSEGYHEYEDYEQALNRYGYVTKVVSFDDKSTKEELFAAAMKWIKDNYFGGVDSFSVKAVDMHAIDGSIQAIRVGDRVRVQFPEPIDGLDYNPEYAVPRSERLLTCIDIDYDLYHPENNSYKFGIPSMALTKNYRSSGKSVKKKSTTSTPSVEVKTEENIDTPDLFLEQVKMWLRSHKVWKKSNGGKEGGPTTSDRSLPYFLRVSIDMDEDGNAKKLLWQPVIQSQTGTTIIWAKTDGKPIGAWILMKDSEVTWNKITSFYLVQYVKEEYGYDLRTDGAVSMPAIMPDGTGNLDISSVIAGVNGGDGDGGTSGLVEKLGSFFGGESGVSKILKLFNVDGKNVAQILLGDGTYKFAEVDANGDLVLDDNGEPVLVDIRSVYKSTQDLKTELEEMGVTVDLLDSQVTLIGQVVGDDTAGLVKDLADMGRTVTTISSDVMIIGQTVGDSTSGLVHDLAEIGRTVTAVVSDVTIIGNKVGDETSGLIHDVASLGSTVTNINSDLTIIGQDVGNLNDKVGDSSSGLIHDLAEMGNTVTAIVSDVTIIGNKVGDETAGLIHDLNEQGQTVTALASDVTIIENALVQKATIADLNAVKAQVDSLESIAITTDNLYANIAALDRVNVRSLTSERGGVSVYSVATTSFTQGGVDCYIPQGVQSVKVVPTSTPGEYELLYRTFASYDADLNTWLSGGTFKKAASSGTNFYLSGSWSGTGLFTVTAKDIDTHAVIPDKTLIRTVEGGSATWDASTSKLSIPIRAWYSSGSGQPTYEETGANATATINFASRINASTNRRTILVTVGSTRLFNETYTDYADGKAAQRSETNVGFYQTSDGYSINAYDTDSTGNPSFFASKVYKLGVSDATVQIQNTSGTKYNYTPTLSLYLDPGTLNKTTGKRTLTVKAGGVSTTATVDITDYNTGKTDGIASARNGINVNFRNRSSGYYIQSDYMDGSNEIVISQKQYKLGLSDSYGNYSRTTQVQIQKADGTSYNSGGVVITPTMALSSYWDEAHAAGRSEGYTDGRNFSLLSKGWSSGGTLTIVAKDMGSGEEISGKTISRTLVQGTAAWDGTTVTVPVRAYYGSTPPTYEDTNMSVSVNVSGKLRTPGTIISNGTVNPGDGYIGLTKAVVNITPELTGIWNDRTFTVSSSPAASANKGTTINLIARMDSNVQYIVVQKKDTGASVPSDLFKKVLALDTGSAPSGASGSRTIKVKYDGSDTSLSYTCPDYGNGYGTGWSGCYGTVGLNSTAATTLSYGASVTVYAQAKASSGASNKTNVASRTITAPSDRYETGYTASYNAMTLSTVSAQSLAPGQSVTIYPRGKQTSSSGYTNKTDVSVTVSAKTGYYSATEARDNAWLFLSSTPVGTVAGEIGPNQYVLAGTALGGGMSRNTVCWKTTDSGGGGSTTPAWLYVVPYSYDLNVHASLAGDQYITAGGNDAWYIGAYDYTWISGSDLNDAMELDSDEGIQLVVYAENQTDIIWYGEKFKGSKSGGGSSASYDLSSVSSGNDWPSSQSMDNFFGSGSFKDTQYVAFPSSRQQYHRYIKFKVGSNWFLIHD